MYKVYKYTIVLHLTYKETWMSQFITNDSYFYIKAMDNLYFKRKIMM